MDLLYCARYSSICSIYSICQKRRRRFLPNFFSVIADIVLTEFIKKWGHCARLREKELLSRYRG